MYAGRVDRFMHMHAHMGKHTYFTTGIAYSWRYTCTHTLTLSLLKNNSLWCMTHPKRPYLVYLDVLVYISYSMYIFFPDHMHSDWWAFLSLTTAFILCELQKRYMCVVTNSPVCWPGRRLLPLSVDHNLHRGGLNVCEREITFPFKNLRLTKLRLEEPLPKFFCGFEVRGKIFICNLLPDSSKSVCSLLQPLAKVLPPHWRMGTNSGAFIEDKKFLKYETRQIWRAKFSQTDGNNVGSTERRCVICLSNSRRSVRQN